jgi:SAM-dependent methyltransferase
VRNPPRSWQREPCTMETAFSCPACVSDAWDEVGTHPYWRVEHEPAGIWHRDDEVRLRRRVLFEVWFPGAAVVTLRSRRCRICGMICYAPRPNDAELSSKYRFLRAALAATPVPSLSAIIEAADAARAAAILDALASRVEVPGRVLDVGGGDGRLMTPFADRGFECFLVDQVEHTRPAVRRIGDRIDDVPPDLTFDAAVCSHVLEHVASPRELLELVRDRLRDGGAVYVEVPWEVFHNNAWNPIAVQPVEHINFFTADAVERILHGAGFTVDKAEVGWGSYEGRPLPVIRAVGVKPQAPRPGPLSEGSQAR